MTPGSLIVVLLLAPLGMLIAHMVVFRLLCAIGRRPTAHTSAIGGIALCLIALLTGVGRLMWPAASGDLLSAVCLLAYVVAVYAALSVLYLDVVNIAETSLHMHLLLEIAWGDRPSLARLIERYSPERMVSERLARLTALGQVRCVDGRYYLGDRLALRVARCVDAWRLVLGLPTSPDEPVSR